MVIRFLIADEREIFLRYITYILLELISILLRNTATRIVFSHSFLLLCLQMRSRHEIRQFLDSIIVQFDSI